jgi:hypothetical protein
MLAVGLQGRGVRAPPDLAGTSEQRRTVRQQDHGREPQRQDRDASVT